MSRRSPRTASQALDAPVKLDQNESPWDLPEPLRSRALARVARAELHRYPAMHADGVAERIAEFEGGPSRASWWRTARTCSSRRS
jgi:histidinol-phosphate aminotransferase